MRILVYLMSCTFIGLLLVVAWIIGYNLTLDSRNDKFDSNVSVCIDTFDIKDFVFELHVQGVKYPDIVLRQACLESGWFKSDVFLRTNNPFGFWYKGEYIIFNDYKSAIVYYKNWQDKWYRTDLPYYEFLDNIGYAEDSSYANKLKNIDLTNLNTLND